MWKTEDAADSWYVMWRLISFPGLRLIRRVQRMWTRRNWESPDSTAFAFSQGTCARRFPTLGVLIRCCCCAPSSHCSACAARIFSSVLQPAAASSHILFLSLRAVTVTYTTFGLCSFRGCEGPYYRRKRPPQSLKSRPHWGASASGSRAAHVQSGGRQRGMHTWGQLHAICAGFNSHQGGRASSLRKHPEQCVFSAPILDSRSKGFSTGIRNEDGRGCEWSSLTYDEQTACPLWLCQHSAWSWHSGHGAHIPCTSAFYTSNIVS